MDHILFDPANIPFTVAIGTVVLLTVIEALLLFAGASVGDVIGGVLPDDLGDVGGLSWLGFGKAPLIVVLACFATLFGIVGLFLQAIAGSVGPGPFPPGIASVVALLLALPLTGRASRAIGRFLPSDETYVGDKGRLVGSIGCIVQGTATPTLPAECRVPDGHGGSLYVQVVPDGGCEAMTEGTKVLIVRREEHHFVAVPFGS